jgi:hypothetical protein
VITGTIPTTLTSISGCLMNFPETAGNCPLIYDPQGCRDEDWYDVDFAAGSYYLSIYTPGPRAVNVIVFDSLGVLALTGADCTGTCVDAVSFTLAAPETLTLNVLGDLNPTTGGDVPYTIVARQATFTDECLLGPGGGTIYTEKREDNSFVLNGATGFLENTAITAAATSTLTVQGCVGNHTYTVGVTDAWDQDSFGFTLGGSASMSVNVSGAFTDDLLVVFFDSNNASAGSGTAVGGTGTAVVTNPYMPAGDYTVSVVGVDNGVYGSYTGPWNYTVTINFTAATDPCTAAPSVAETEATCDLNMAHALLDPGTGTGLYNLQAANSPGTTESVTWAGGNIVQGGGCYKITGTLAMGCNEDFGAPYTTHMSDSDGFNFYINSTTGAPVNIEITWTGGRNVYLFGERLAATNALAINQNAGTSGTFANTITTAVGLHRYILSVLDFDTTPPSTVNSTYTIEMTY